MKKLVLTVATGLVFLSSCGKSEVCECVDSAVSMMKEFRDANGNMNKLQEIQDKHKDDLMKCDKLNDTDKKKFEEEAKKCDGYSELENLGK